MLASQIYAHEVIFEGLITLILIIYARFLVQDIKPDAREAKYNVSVDDYIQATLFIDLVTVFVEMSH